MKRTGDEGGLRRAGAALAMLAILTALAGCGATASAGDRISGKVLTIYASAPLHGTSGDSGQAVISGATLALSAAGNRMGGYRIVLKTLDDSTPQRGGWDPGQTTDNARLAVRDPTTIGYIGEFNSGASAISIPLLNRADIPQISPASTAVGLTSAGADTTPGEPQKYYPTGVRTFARVVPNDSIQALAQVRVQQGMGCQKTYVLDDGEVDGLDFAKSFGQAAQTANLQLAGVQAFRPGAQDYSTLVAGVVQAAPDCVMISAGAGPGAVILATQIATALPRAMLFGSAGLADGMFTDPAHGGISRSLDSRVLITMAALDATAYPASARAFFASYERRFGMPQPYAMFGYEAMRLLLSAIERASRRGTRPALRSSVLSEIYSTRNRRSVLGTYSINSAGDTTLRRYGVYRIVAGRLTFWETTGG